MRGLLQLLGVGVFMYALTYLAGLTHNDPWLWALLFIGLFVVLFVFFFWLNLRGRRDYLEGCALLNQARLVDALEAFTRAADKSPQNAAFECQRAVALMQLLRLEEAERSFEKAKALSRIARHTELFDVSAQLNLALRGKTALAVGDASLAQRVFTRAVEHARKREWQAALDQLGHPSQQMLIGTTRVLKDAVTAWCHSELGHEKRQVDLTMLRQPGVADVATFWPELAEFLKSTAS